MLYFDKFINGNFIYILIAILPYSFGSFFIGNSLKLLLLLECFQQIDQDIIDVYNDDEIFPVDD
jgi:hypothetical protein